MSFALAYVDLSKILGEEHKVSIADEIIGVSQLIGASDRAACPPKSTHMIYYLAVYWPIYAYLGCMATGKGCIYRAPLSSSL